MPLASKRGEAVLSPSALHAGVGHDEIALRVGVHDSSRLEWIASVTLPKTGERRYQIEFTVEIPSNVYSIHDVWEHLEVYTRLQSPSEEGQPYVELSDMDELRRDTLGIAHRIKLQRQKFERTCVGAAAVLVEALHPTLEPDLREIVARTVDVVAEIRTHLATENLMPEVRREATLADEFVSHQFLDFLSSAQKSLEEVLLGPTSRLRELDPSWTEGLHEALADALARELAYRQEKGFPNPRADSRTQLSHFVERGSRLKKHFQDVLFLDVESYRVDHHLRNWTGVAAASVAAAFWLAFTLLPIASGTRAGIGVGTFAVLFAAAYALKDRMKELTRGWLAGHLMRLYGQRVMTLRLPTRLDPQRRVLVQSRESFNAETQIAEDFLNQEVGRTRRVVVLRYTMRGQANASPALDRSGLTSIKHIFRHDVTPIFSRLDNAVKRVPVLDEATRRVCFVDAPKEYRLPVRLSARDRDTVTHADGLLVLSKRGIERFEPAE